MPTQSDQQSIPAHPWHMVLLNRHYCCATAGIPSCLPMIIETIDEKI
jgi:hypothetical protein